MNLTIVTGKILNLVAEYDTMAHFDSIAGEIEQIFDQLIGTLIERKNALLRRLLQLREDYQNKESAREEAVQELEQTQEHIKQLSLKANLNIPIHQQASQVYEHGIEQLATPTKPPSILFCCPTRDRLVALMKTFGEVVEKFDYTDKKMPIRTGGTFGSDPGGEFNGPRGLALDEINKVFYVADIVNSRIHMFSFEAKFITNFGEEVLQSPWGITTTADHIYVTDPGVNYLLRFDKKTQQLIDTVGGEGDKEGELLEPTQLAIDTNGDVFVVDRDNNRISIFSKKFRFLYFIKHGKLFSPYDIKLTEDFVVILDWGDKCVNFFTREGDLLSSCVSQHFNNKSMVDRPFFFCIDKACNILISDYQNNDIKIVSKSGELMHTIGKKGGCDSERGSFFMPYGIAISEAGDIYIASNNPLNIIQIF